MVPNAPLASAPGNEFHPLILVMLDIHGGQVKIDMKIKDTVTEHIALLNSVPSGSLLRRIQEK